MELEVEQLAKRLGAELAGSGGVRIGGVGPVEAAGENEVTFVSDGKHLSKLKDCSAAAVIVSAAVEGFNRPQLIVKDVNAALIDVLGIFAPRLKHGPAGIDETAKVAEDAKIAEGVSIGPYVVIEDGAEVGRRTVIAGGCKIGQNSKIGRDCRINGNVVVEHNCRIGNNCIIQANTTIGSTGFGYYFIDGAHRLVPHNGGVLIEDYVEIGANCCIDRAKFGDTVIGAGTKIDNLVQIAHNVVIGRCCLIAALTGIAGSCSLGDGVVIGGQVGVVDSVQIGDGVMVGAGSGVIGDVRAGEKLWGTPAIDRTEELRRFSLTRRLPKLVEQLRELEKRIKALEASTDDKK